MNKKEIIEAEERFGQLEGKTIFKIKRQCILIIGCRSYEKVIIEFVDGTKLELKTWDVEQYSSGIEMEIKKCQIKHMN